MDEAEEAVRGLTGAGLEEVRGLLRASGGDPDAAAQLWLERQEGRGSAPRPSEAAPRPPAVRPAARPAAARGGVATLASLRDSEDGGAGADGKGPNDYFAGSGQLVRGRPEGGPEGGGGERGAVSGLFDAARALGAREGSAEDLPGYGERAAPFSGRSNTLSGQGDVPAQGGARPGDPPTRHLVEFWENGVFTVNNGPARGVMDPANLEFMQAISRGECPAELEGPDGGGVEVSLMRHHGEYEEPEAPKYVAFSGQGRTLAGDAPPEPAAPEAEAGGGGGSARSELVVDEAQPATSVQLRLSDGTRMVARFNLTHTVADLRAFIDRSRPGAARAYKLATADFPPKALTDPAATIGEAGLANAVVIQRG